MKDGSASSSLMSVEQEIQAAHERLINLKKHGVVVSQRVTILEKCLAEWINTQNLVDELYEDALTPYAQLTCRKLTQDFHTILPRELRDQIYSYLVNDETVSDLESLIKAASGIDSDPWYIGGTAKIPFFLCSSYVYRPVAQEILNPSYKKIFAVSDVEPENIHAFLTADALGVGINATQFIRTLSIWWGLINPQRTLKQLVEADFKALELLPGDSGIVVRNTLRGLSSASAEEMALCLDCFVPVYASLMKKGVSMTFDCFYQGVRVDLETYFVDKDAWYKEFSTISEQIRLEKEKERTKKPEYQVTRFRLKKHRGRSIEDDGEEDLEQSEAVSSQSSDDEDDGS